MMVLTIFPNHDDDDDDDDIDVDDGDDEVLLNIFWV